MRAHKVILVDDDTELRSLLADQLSATGDYEVAVSGTGSDALEAARAGDADLMVLDMGLPDIDGKDVVREMRRQGIGMPVLMLTARDAEEDHLAGLEAGADDFVAKPFRFPVLEARVRAALRKGASRLDTRFRIGRKTFVQAEKALLDERGNRIPLTEREVAVLLFLRRLHGQAASRETLLKEVWGYNRMVNTHTVETHVYRLRRKLEEDPANPRHLVTEGRGYRLVT